MATLGFTPATGQDCFSIETTQRTSSAVTSALRGEEVREFYEKLIKDSKAQDLSNGAVSQKDNDRGNRNKQRNRESVRTARRRLGAHTDSAPQRGGGTSEGNRRGESQNTERSIELMGLRLLHCAQEGNISGLKDLLSKGADINFQVQYLTFSVFLFTGYCVCIYLIVIMGYMFRTGHFSLDCNDVCQLVWSNRCC